VNDVRRNAAFLALASEFLLFVGKLARVIPFKLDPDRDGPDTDPEIEAAWSRFRLCVQRVPFEREIYAVTVLEKEPTGEVTLFLFLV
jgi:hypothetical protein